MEPTTFHAFAGHVLGAHRIVRAERTHPQRMHQMILDMAYAILADVRPLFGCESCGTPSFWVRPFARILKWSAIGKRIVAGVLMALMFLVVALATVEILYGFVRFLLPGVAVHAAYLLLSEQDVLLLLGLFLSVLITLELIETVEVYFRDLKQSLGMGKLSARTLAGVRKEMLAFVLLYNLVRKVMAASSCVGSIV